MKLLSFLSLSFSSVFPNFLESIDVRIPRSVAHSWTCITVGSSGDCPLLPRWNSQALILAFRPMTHRTRHSESILRTSILPIGHKSTFRSVLLYIVLLFSLLIAPHFDKIRRMSDSFLPAFGLASLLIKLFEFTVLLVKGKSTLPRDLCVLVANEMPLLFTRFLSLSQQLFELDSWVRVFVSGCLVGLFLDEFVIVCTSLRLLSNMPDGIWFVSPYVHPIKVLLLLFHFLSLPISLLKPLMPLMVISFSNSSVRNFISLLNS